jgi:hypothetical protein
MIDATMASDDDALVFFQPGKHNAGLQGMAGFRRTFSGPADFRFTRTFLYHSVTNPGAATLGYKNTLS